MTAGTGKGPTLTSWGAPTGGVDEQRRRVRDQVRDGAAVAATSAATSMGLAVLLLLVFKLAG